MRRRAFTLVEVLAVILLMGLLAGSVAWSLAEEVRRSSRTGLVARIVHADRMARLSAGRFGLPCVLRLDMSKRRVSCVLDGKEKHVAELPAPSRIDRVVVPGADPLRESRGRDIRSGVVDIAYSTGGRSITYATRLVFRDDADATWLVFSGLTGEVTSVDDDDEIKDLFAMLTTGWTDAH